MRARTPATEEDINRVVGEEGWALFIGNAKAARDRGLLAERGIVHVINCTLPYEVQDAFGGDDGLAYSRLSLADQPHPTRFDPHPTLRRGAEAIAALRRAKQPVLVHCLGGQNRSASVCAAYLLAVSAFGSVEECVAHLRRCRPIVNPNPFYKAALETFSDALASNRAV